MSGFAAEGYCRLPYDAGVAAWAAAALTAARAVCQTPGDLRHGRTWRVGVDELPNAPDGSIGGVALQGGWAAWVDPPCAWHRAQLSVIYPGYPRQDPNESDAAHRFRVTRDAAHLDGLLPEGPDKRRHLREAHAFVLGLSLNDVAESPLVVWPGSHVIIQRAFTAAFVGHDPAGWGDIDVTEVYQAARREVFESCARLPVPARPGEAVLVHRHLVHGVAPWGDATGPEEGRMIAYFRPELDNIADWL